VNTVLLVHSSGFNARQWRRLAESLGAYEVLSPNLLGYDTPWPDGKPFHFREDVEHLAAQLTEPAHVVGHSYGGFLALQLALAHPELVRSLSLYEPVAFALLTDAERADVDNVSGATGDIESWLERFVDWWNGPGAWAALAEPTKAAFRAVGWKVSQEVASLAADQTESYASITVPTLLLAGEQTRAVERLVVEKLARVLPNASVQLFPGLGHMGPIVAPALINAAIKTHIDSN
jgi:pimeloyl-ACP methyl ester carboxylesterase